MMTKTNINILKALLSVNILGATFIFIFLNIKYLYAFEIGFITSSLVVSASLLAYRRMVDTRVELNIITFDDSKDVIDQLEDPYDLYSEDIVEDTPKVEKDLVEVVKEERKKLKDNRSVYQILKDTKAALSVYRMGAYVVLILGFLYLNRHGLLHIPTYIVSLGLPPMIIVLIFVSQKETQTEDTIQ